MSTVTTVTISDNSNGSTVEHSQEDACTMYEEEQQNLLGAANWGVVPASNLEARQQGLLPIQTQASVKMEVKEEDMDD